MLREIGTVDRIPEFIARAKDKNDPFRLMGFGHRVYKNFDPRARVLKEACDEAMYNEGHNSYNGTISTNHNFVMYPLKKDELLADWQMRVWDDPKIEKWGPCACVKDPDGQENDQGEPLWHFAGWAAS